MEVLRLLVPEKRCIAGDQVRNSNGDYWLHSSRKPMDKDDSERHDEIGDDEGRAVGCMGVSTKRP